MNILDLPLLALLRLFIYAIYLLSWHTFNICKIIKRMINGTVNIPHKHARLGRILFRHNRDDEEISRREDFVTIDNEFIHVNELKSANWTVFTFDNQGVIFVELPRPLTEFTIDKYPFVFTPIFRSALRTAEIDLDTFLTLADELEVDYKPPRTLFFTNTARCASTLFGSMLQHDEYSYVIAEHHSLINMSIGYSEGYWSIEEVEKLLPALIKFIRKCIPDDKLLVLKGASTEVKLVPFLTKLMPEIEHIFMFRKKGYDSVEKMLLRDPQQLLLAHIYQYSPFFATLFGFISACEGRFYRELKPKMTKEYAMIVYGAPYYYYKKNISCFDFDIVWHHELINDSKKVLTSIYEKLGLPLNLITKAKECLKKDSQTNTFLSQSSISNIHVTSMTPEVKTNLKKYAEIFEIEPDVSGLYDD